MKRRIAACLTAACSLCGPLAGYAQDVPPPAPAAAQPAVAPYLRVTEAEDGNVLKLEVAIREFRSADPEKPVVYLTGAVHIGDKSFYAALQEFLDGQEVVLFEGVKPPGTGDALHDLELDEDAMVEKTERRLRFLGVAAAAYRQEHKKNPASMDELAGGVGGRLAPFVRASLGDAWGNPVEVAKSPAGRLDFVSLGADGEPGGEGADADLRLSDQKPITKAERGEDGHGIQQKLAEALGLVFQLDVMTHDHPNWRSSDMSIDQVQQRLDESGADMDVLGVLDGTSLFGRVAEVVLDLISWMPGGPEMMKLMMLEMLSRANEMIENMPGEMAALFEVLLQDRNGVVIADLTRVIENEPEIKTIGIIYGAGHLPDLERRLGDELGYTPAGDRWNAAITLDLKAIGMTAAQARSLRAMLRKSIDAQLKALKR